MQHIGFQRRVLTGKREKNRPDDDAHMGNAAGMHVLAHETMAAHRIGKGCVLGIEAARLADDHARARSAGRQRKRLPAPRQIRRLDGAGKEIRKAGHRLVHRLAGEIGLAPCLANQRRQ
ncbi:hypothetical protein D3C87_1672080 [compost metagenome]